MPAVALFYFAVVASCAKMFHGFETPFYTCNLILSKVIDTASY